MSGMRYQHIVTLVLFLFVCVPASGRQVGSWQAVEDLDPGTRISVKEHRGFPAFPCNFERADDQVLVCSTVHPVPFGPRRFTFKRGSVRRVRLEYSDAFNARVGGAIGFGAGATIGAVACRGPDCRNGARVPTALILGGIGYLPGLLFGQMFPILHGQVVYSR